MEIYSSTTRFALACNQSSKVIEPIQSRCAIVRFTRLSDSEVLQRLLHVCRTERVGCESPPDMPKYVDVSATVCLCRQEHSGLHLLQTHER